MSDIEHVVADYFAMWSEADPDRRAQLIASAWTADGRYVDPRFEARGHTAIDRLAQAAQEQFPGCEFHRTSGVDIHHDRVRWSWAMTRVGGRAALAVGVDYAQVSDDGRLSEVTGFYDMVG
jgi:hypothetical protein